MRISRLAICSVAAVAVGGLLTGPAAVAASRQPARPDPMVVGIAGNIAYLTSQQTVKIATVHTNGTTAGVQTVGPITALTGKQTMQIFDLTASGDGQWLAWQENVFKPVAGGVEPVKTVLVLREQSNGAIVHLDTDQAPLGFAKDQLVTSNADTTERLDLEPTPHLVKVVDHQFPMAAYSKGVIDTHAVRSPPGPSTTEQLRLTTFAGAHTILHNYVLAPTNYRGPDAAWVSSDADHVVIERGNHQDFGGLGPSSLADEFSLTGGHKRTMLGHYGTSKAQWRIADVSYAGHKDAVWAAWERATSTGADTLVAWFNGHRWVAVAHHAIVVAGAPTGWVVIQPGKYVSTSKDEEIFKTVPTRHALLRTGSTTVSLNAEGTSFVWIAPPAV
jgi:hypothetical protein